MMISGRTNHDLLRGSSRVLLAARSGVALFATALVAGCTAGSEAEDAELRLQPLESPAPPGSSEPNLFARDGEVLISWQESLAGGGHALRFARLEADGWTPARTIAQGDGWFANWADFPSVVLLPDGRLAAHWLVRSGPDTYAYDVHIALSDDGGDSWSDAVMPHDDGTETEHGFASLFPWDDGSLAAIWLDGRNFADVADGHHGHGAGPDMTLRKTTLSATGERGADVVIDPRVCDCCQTSVSLTSEGPVVLYRDRSADEIRDISISRFRNGGWTPPATVHDDGWRITGCPVNGPASAASGARLAVAWFTAADDDPRVLLAFSDDAGRSFGEPLRVDAGDPIGRVDVVLDGEENALVSWVERAGDEAEIRLRLVTPAGGGGAWRIAGTSTARASGFPRIARTGDHLVVAWTETGSDGGPSHVRTALARMR
jgi:hypothetical protein